MEYSLYPPIVFCSIILAFTKNNTCFELVMFHVITSFVLFDHVVKLQKLMRFCNERFRHAHKFCIGQS